MPSGVYERTTFHLRIARRNVKRAIEASHKSPKFLAAARRSMRIAQRVSASLPKTENQLVALDKARSFIVYNKTRKQRKANAKNFKKAQRKLKWARKHKTGKCEICHEEKFMFKDHCHRTGKKRGKLCFTCNLGIGYFKDDTKLLQVAIKYLKRFQ